MTLRMGIDLGGTKTEVLVVDARRQSLYRERFATPAQDYTGILDLIAARVRASAYPFR